MIQRCPNCDGTGKIRITVPLPMHVPCLRCEGTGKIDTEARAKASFWRWCALCWTQWFRQKGERRRDNDR